MPASFNGVALFGAAVTMMTGDDERDTQQNRYFGLNGREVLDGGSRGRITQVQGVLAGTDLATLNANIALVRSYRDGRAYVLVDTSGRSWPYCRLVGFSEVGPLRRGTGATAFFRQYTATIEHLI